ncbi:hypothetical protein CEXT_71401 [Caerostris extrusa]|uniref:Uncharacterized protein n=1 Tax=Caerostris extrusa TaxID=172846 RepID=A0AAV4XZD6_CAEEX|nr:hypothetical protein CEXT_71401 [Caerostris extrusa]
MRILKEFRKNILMLKEKLTKTSKHDEDDMANILTVKKYGDKWIYFSFQKKNIGTAPLPTPIKPPSLLFFISSSFQIFPGACFTPPREAEPKINSASPELIILLTSTDSNQPTVTRDRKPPGDEAVKLMFVNKQPSS